jgi:protein-L-isoaspartate(D-aspartate) O-methyltransferase
MHYEQSRFNRQHANARFNMVEQQIRTWDVLDPKVLHLFSVVPRENFVPKAYQGLAFADIEIPLANGQTMLSPKLEGRILQSLDVQSTDRVLHIGTGSGYFDALLAQLAKEVISVEIDSEISAAAAHSLLLNNVANVDLLVADGVAGLPSKQPYDIIVYTASSPVEPDDVREQLKLGGKLFIVLGQAPVMRATLIQRVTQTGFKEEVLFETCIPVLKNAPQGQQFKF